MMVIETAKKMLSRIKKVLFLMVLGTSIAYADDWSRAQIDFWKKIYTEVNSTEWVIHDSMNLKHVYRVVSRNPDQAKKEVIETLKSIYQKNLHRKSVDVDQLSESERILFESMESNEDPRSYHFASQPGRVRAQQGLKNQLQKAQVVSKQYLGRMEEMFIEEGVPVEMTRLPFVESCFVNEACSIAGAIGIWQFMPKTAMKELRVDSSIDERYDPLKSTRAAAKYLKENYGILKNWNLAVMAYHHGAGLVNRARKRLKTDDPFQIIRYFKDSRFQFASRNYLFEWMAMVEIDSNRPYGKLPEYITVSFQKKLPMADLIKDLRLSESDLKLLNPHFREPIWSGKSTIPAHYPVRMSGITLEEFRKRGYSSTN
jgi:membrane-bound lytic murein transglycosylase D